MKKLFFVVSLIIIFAAQLSAQDQKYLNWNVSYKNKSNGDIELYFKTLVPEGFRLYSPYNPEGASIPLSILLDESKNYAPKGKIIELQKPEEHYEEIFEVTEKFFRKKADFKLVIKPKSDKPFDVTGKISGQLCNDEYFCVQERADFKVNVTPLLPEKKAESEDLTKNNQSKLVVDDSKKDTTANLLKDTTKMVADTLSLIENNANSESAAVIVDNNDVNNGSLWGMFWIAFLAGLAAIFTPCVFPMIPMTMSFFLKQKNGNGKMYAVIYGLSIIALYTLPVALLILIGGLLGGADFLAGIFNALSTHWLPNLIFFIVFFVFALSFLGMFEIILPSKFVNRAEQRGDKGDLVGIFFLAFVLVLVSFSCTGPIVGSVLVESASGNNFMKPIIAILGFSLAFSIPFTLFAFFPGLMKKLPKSGGWLNTVKVVLGFAELALGLKFLSVADQTYHWHILDRETYLVIWISIGIMLTLYLLGKLRLPNDDELTIIKVPRLILAILTLAFTIYMIPGLFGAPLRALAGYIPPITTQDFVLNNNSNFTTSNQQPSTLCNSNPKYSDVLKLPYNLKSYYDYQEALQCAKEKQKPLLLIFTGHGCVNCRKMEENVWSNSKVQNIMQNDFVMCALFTDDRTLSSDGKNTIGEINTELQIADYHINAQPYYVIINPQTHQLLKSPTGYNPDVESFLEWLKL